MPQSLGAVTRSPYLKESHGHAPAWEQIALLTPPQRTEPPSTPWNKDCYLIVYEAEWSRESESDWLSDALSELAQVDSLVEADGLAPIKERTKNEAKRLLEALNPQSITPVIYPEDEEIVIHFKAPTAPSSVGIEISNDGRGACYSHIDGRNRSAHYGTSRDIPDEFVLARLRSLSSLK